MLILTRRVGETITIGSNVTVTVLGVALAEVLRSRPAALARPCSLFYSLFVNVVRIARGVDGLCASTLTFRYWAPAPPTCGAHPSLPSRPPRGKRRAPPELSVDKWAAPMRRAPGFRTLRLHQGGTDVPAIGMQDERSNPTVEPPGQGNSRAKSGETAKRHAAITNNLNSWRNYRNWAEKIRGAWEEKK
jgi:hypothetical protein